jgi:tRNA pseudouridine13 synthase
MIGRQGVPNYFGAQRFGRDGSNLLRISAGLRALRPQERGFVLSAARSLLFNAVLAERVRAGSWNRLETGDLANLDGRGAPQTRGRVLELENRVSAALSPAPELVGEAGMEQERRALRLAVRDLEWSRESNAVVIRFRLTRGSFATTVLREIFDTGGVEAGEGEEG